MNRKGFDRAFDEYRKFLREEVRRFLGYGAAYRGIQERRAQRPEGMALARGFFQVVESALFSAIVLWADKLFDERGQRGFFNFLTFVEYNRRWLSGEERQRRSGFPAAAPPPGLEAIQAHRERIRALAALKSFRLWRNKFHGHFDRQYFFDQGRLDADAPLGWPDLEAAGALMGEILNAYSEAFDGTRYAWDPKAVDDLDVLLDRAEGRPEKLPVGSSGP